MREKSALSATKNILKSNRGYTIAELLVAMAIGGIVLSGIAAVYQNQTKGYRTQNMVVEMQQNARGSLFLLEKEVRMAGFDPADTDNFAITDIRLRDTSNNLSTSGYSTFTFAYDDNEDGVLDTGETITYKLSDWPSAAPDGVVDLIRNDGGSDGLVAESIYAFGLAYSFDDDEDGELDTSAGGNVIWAIDSDNDNDLDMNLDDNDDGYINATDDGDADGFLNDNALSTDIDLDKIRGIRIWVLARTKNVVQDFSENRIYTVGNRVVNPSSDSNSAVNYRYQLITAVVKCRNLIFSQYQ